MGGPGQQQGGYAQQPQGQPQGYGQQVGQVQAQQPGYGQAGAYAQQNQVPATPAPMPEWASRLSKLGPVLFDPAVGTAEVRKWGLGALGIGIFLIAVNVVMLLAMDRFYPYLVVLMPPSLGLGGFMLITGKPVDAITGQIPPWWQGAAGAVAVGGLVIGVALAAFLAA